MTQNVCGNCMQILLTQTCCFYNSADMDQFKVTVNVLNYELLFIIV